VVYGAGHAGEFNGRYIREHTERIVPHIGGGCGGGDADNADASKMRR